MESEEKPKRLYFKSYIQLIRNSVNSNLFRNFYVRTSKRGEFDALDDGYNSCAFFVSGVLVMFRKLENVHGTVAGTVKDLEKSGWLTVKEPKTGDILVWEAQKFDDGWKLHIGFYLGNGRAISTSYRKKIPIEHDLNFGERNRKIEQIYRMENWNDKS